MRAARLRFCPSPVEDTPAAADSSGVAIMPISLSDSEMSAVIDAAKPLQARQRSEFLREVIVELQKYEVIGPGIIGRVTAKLQRLHLAPRTYHTGSKWG